MAETSDSTREILEKIELTKDQQEKLAKHAGAAAGLDEIHVVKLGRGDIDRLGPGIVSAVGIMACW